WATAAHPLPLHDALPIFIPHLPSTPRKPGACVSGKRGLQPEGRHPPRGVAASGFRPLRKIPHCCLPQESGPCLSPSVADRPLRPATRRSHGRPSPHQQADRPRGPPGAETPFPTQPCDQEGTSGISPPFEGLSRSPGQVPHVLLTRSPLEHPEPKPRASPFDLHVLSTPPASVLSQDQTLHQKRHENHTGPHDKQRTPHTPTGAQSKHLAKPDNPKTQGHPAKDGAQTTTPNPTGPRAVTRTRS